MIIDDEEENEAFSTNDNAVSILPNQTNDDEDDENNDAFSTK